MLVIATIMAMVAPSLGLFVSARPVTDAAALFVSLTDYARGQAVAEGRDYRVNLDPDRGAFWLTAQDGAEFPRLGTEFGRDFLLPEGTTAAWTAAGTETAETTVPGLIMPGRAALPEDAGQAAGPVITFRPDGSTDPGTLVLTDRRGNRVQVACASPMDRFRVGAAADQEGGA
jgi:hypothetical protein